EAKKLLAAGVNVAAILGVFSIERPGRFRDHQIRKPDNRVEWRPQLMAYRRQESRLGPRGHLRLFLRRPQLNFVVLPFGDVDADGNPATGRERIDPDLVNA